MLHKNVHCQCYIQYSGLPIKYSFNCFLKAGRVLVSRIVAGRLFQVRGPATSKARSPILVLVLGTKTSDDFDDRSRDLLQSSDSGLIFFCQIRWCAVVQTFIHQDGKFELDALAYSKPLKFISGCSHCLQFCCFLFLWLRALSPILLLLVPLAARTVSHSFASGYSGCAHCLSFLCFLFLWLLALSLIPLLLVPLAARTVSNSVASCSTGCSHCLQFCCFLFLWLLALSLILLLLVPLAARTVSNYVVSCSSGCSHCLQFCF